MDQPLRAHTANEARYYLMVTPCEACGEGPWEVDETREAPAGGVTAVRAVCRRCQASREFRFVCERDVPPGGSDAEMINPTDEPSGIIDLGQWLSLFYLLVESASSERSRAATRRIGYRAALCLAEALKFYTADDELPPEEAFFSEATKRIYREHPENFARQRLRDMQAKLPTLGAMARRISLDHARRRRWWQFWRR
jgi:hypothetical protein